MATPAVSKVKGTGYNQVQVPRLSPEQMSLFKQVFSQIQPGLTGALGHLGDLAGGGNEETWKQLEAPALRQFGQLQGNIASRFSGAGSGARRSSGFQNALSGAGADLAERLQSQRLGLQQDAIGQLLGLYGNLMGTQTQDTGFLPRQKPWWQQLLLGLNQAGSQAVGNFAGIGASKAAGFI